MHKSTLWLIGALGTFVAAQGEFDKNDYPNQCRAACDPVATQAKACNDPNSADDSGDSACICKGPNMQNQIPACSSCVTPLLGNSEDDEEYQGINSLLSACSFSTTLSNAVATGTTLYADSYTNDGSSGVYTETLTLFGPAVGAVTTAITTSGDGQVATVTSAVGSAATSATSQGMADGFAAPIVGAMAGGLAVLAL